MNRRNFFKLAGKATAGIALLITGKSVSQPKEHQVDIVDIAADDMGGYLVPLKYQEEILNNIQQQSVIRGQGVRVSWAEEEQGNTAGEVLQRRKHYSSFNKWLKSGGL